MIVNHRFWPLYSGIQANQAAILSEVNESGLSTEAAVDKLIGANRLALNPVAQSAWSEYTYLNPDQRHTAGFLAFAEHFAASEAKHELAALQREFPNVRGDIEALRHQKARHELIDEICALLASKDPSGRGGKYSSFNIAAVRKQVLDGQWSLEKLQARKAEIEREQALAKRPLQELKQMVHEHYNQPVQFPGWPTLPDRMYQKGKGWIVVDAPYLENLIREDFFEFRRLVKLFGPHVDHRRGLVPQQQY